MQLDEQTVERMWDLAKVLMDLGGERQPTRKQLWHAHEELGVCMLLIGRDAPPGASRDETIAWLNMTRETVQHDLNALAGGN